jgi:hypothetical protein
VRDRPIGEARGEPLGKRGEFLDRGGVAAAVATEHQPETLAHGENPVMKGCAAASFKANLRFAARGSPAANAARLF